MTTPMPNERDKAADELNNRCIEYLKQKGVLNGSFILVVGAGISIPLMPSGKGLRKSMAEACGIPDDDTIPFWDFFDPIKKQFPQIFRETIIKTFCDAPEWHSESCHHIVSIPSASIVTLNYDDHLQDAFSRKFGSGWDTRFAIYPTQKEKTFAWPADFVHTPHLLAAHGYRVKDDTNPELDLSATWPDDGIILTRSQYEEHYFGKHHYLFHWWKEVLCRFPCLFIATSLEEPGISEVINRLAEEKNPQFLAQTRIQLQDVRPMKDISGRNASILYPEPTSPLPTVQQFVYDPKPGYRGLLQVLSSLSGEPLRGPLESGKRAPKFPGSYSIS